MAGLGTHERRYVRALRFGWLTPAYDVVVRATTRERAFKAALVAQAAIKPGHRVLDLACGTGTLAVLVARNHRDSAVTGIDGDPAILQIASRKAARAGVHLRLDEALASSLPYDDGSFDRVLSSLFFHHLQWAEKLRAAAEAFRVLALGGEFHVADWARAESGVSRLAFLPVQLLDGFPNTVDNVRGRLPQCFQDAGFADVTQSAAFTTMFGTLGLFRAVKRG